MRKFACSSPLVHLTLRSFADAVSFFFLFFAGEVSLLSVYALLSLRLVSLARTPTRAHVFRESCRSLVCCAQWFGPPLGVSFRSLHFPLSLSAVFAAVCIIRSGARLLFPAACCAVLFRFGLGERRPLNGSLAFGLPLRHGCRRSARTDAVPCPLHSVFTRTIPNQIHWNCLRLHKRT